MLKLAPATEQSQHFVSNLRESFWGDLNGRTREAWKKFFEADSERRRDRFAVVDAYERNAEHYRNGYYERDFVTVLGTLRFRIARTHGQSFLPAGLEEFQGVRQDGRRELLSFMRRQGESQGAREGLLNVLYRRGLRGKHLQLIITDCCPSNSDGLSAHAESALLGAQDAQHQREGPRARSRRAEANGAGYLPSRGSQTSLCGVPLFQTALAN